MAVRLTVELQRSGKHGRNSGETDDEQDDEEDNDDGAGNGEPTIVGEAELEETDDGDEDDVAAVRQIDEPPNRLELELRRLVEHMLPDRVV